MELFKDLNRPDGSYGEVYDYATDERPHKLRSRRVKGLITPRVLVSRSTEQLLEDIRSKYNLN